MLSTIFKKNRSNTILPIVERIRVIFPNQTDLKVNVIGRLKFKLAF